MAESRDDLISECITYQENAATAYAASAMAMGRNTLFAIKAQDMAAKHAGVARYYLLRLVLNRGIIK